MAFSASPERPIVSPSSPAVVFRDGLGERRQIVDSTRGGTVELLCLRHELTSVSSFEFALRERVNRLSSFRHAYFAPVRGVERVNDPPDTIAIVSDVTPGLRLSELLGSLEERRATLDITAALCLIRQIVPAVAMLHESARDVAHGAISPERLIVTANARLVLVDYVLGAALEQLRYSQERYWTELRIALPKTGGAPRFDHRADVLQIGLVALSLILGRALRRDEYPTHVRELVASAWSASATGGGFEPLPPGLCAWLGRTLQLEALTAFPSAIEARADLDKILGDGGPGGSPSGLQTVLSRYQGHDRPRGSAAAAGVTGRVLSDIDATWPTADGTRRPATLEALDLERLADPVGAGRRTSIPDLPSLVPTHLADLTELNRAPIAPEAVPKASVAALDLPPIVPPVLVDTASIVLPELARLATPALPEIPELAVLDRQSLAAPLGVSRPASPEPPPDDRVVPLARPEGFKVWRWVGAAAIVLPALVGGGALTAKRVGAKPSAGALRDMPVPIVAGDRLAPQVDSPVNPSALASPQGQIDQAGGRADTNSGAAAKQNGATSAAASTSAIGSVAVPAPVPGWIAVSGPLVVQLFEQGRFLGDGGARISLSPGVHEIELVNDGLGYRASRVVAVTSAKGLTLAVDVPKAPVALNALPWAEVWIDGERVGETPIGNLSLAIGSHEVVFRHPDLGEERQTVVVGLKNPARLSVDLRKK